MSTTKPKTMFGFCIGDTAKLSQEWFDFVGHLPAHRTYCVSKMRLRRFQVVGFRTESYSEKSVRVKRLDLPSGRRELYHHTFLVKVQEVP